MESILFLRQWFCLRLMRSYGWRWALRRCWQTSLEPLRDRYDYLIVDTCPALGALTINALAAADGVVITVNPQLLAMKGLQDFLKTIKKIKKRINPKLEVEGILFTMCDMRTNLCKVISEQVVEAFEGRIPDL